MSVAVAPTYKLTGTLLEACSCGVLCPCWIGEDPDHGTCDSCNAYHFERDDRRRRRQRALDHRRSARSPATCWPRAAGGWPCTSTSARPTSSSRRFAPRYAGDLGGPLGDLAGLIGEVVSVERAPITHETRGGEGVLEIGGGLLRRACGRTPATTARSTTLRDSLFSTVPGSPAYVGVADHLKVEPPSTG